ncbi:hypothetical protein E2C01_002823 [Portunus trituberculatus]|uniref:Uncharacterized protein n=1 Tax=Portunus trituberculatus TaxID=210409 RepID=A0A5B7CRR5_PORTR|nr:hypothetical protein [Portunus trituberculatus]
MNGPPWYSGTKCALASEGSPSARKKGEKSSPPSTSCPESRDVNQTPFNKTIIDNEWKHNLLLHLLIPVWDVGGSEPAAGQGTVHCQDCCIMGLSCTPDTHRCLHVNLAYRTSWVVHKSSELPGHPRHLIRNVEVEQCDISIGGVRLQQTLLAYLWHQADTIDWGQVQER